MGSKAKNVKCEQFVNLIEAVRNEPSLWDMRSQTYRIKDKKDIWTRIAQETNFTGLIKNFERKPGKYCVLIR